MHTLANARVVLSIECQTVLSGVFRYDALIYYQMQIMSWRAVPSLSPSALNVIQSSHALQGWVLSNLLEDQVSGLKSCVFGGAQDDVRLCFSLVSL